MDALKFNENKTLREEEKETDEMTPLKTELTDENGKTLEYKLVKSMRIITEV